MKPSNDRNFPQTPAPFKRIAFGFDIVEGKLVPNPIEYGALGLGRKLRQAGKSYRYIAEAWVTELHLPRFDAKSIQRMLDRNEIPA